MAFDSASVLIRDFAYGAVTSQAESMVEPISYQIPWRTQHANSEHHQEPDDGLSRPIQEILHPEFRRIDKLSLKSTPKTNIECSLSEREVWNPYSLKRHSDMPSNLFDANLARFCPVQKSEGSGSCEFIYKDLSLDGLTAPTPNDAELGSKAAEIAISKCNCNSLPTHNHAGGDHVTNCRAHKHSDFGESSYLRDYSAFNVCSDYPHLTEFRNRGLCENATTHCPADPSNRNDKTDSKTRSFNSDKAKVSTSAAKAFRTRIPSHFSIEVSPVQRPDTPRPSYSDIRLSVERDIEPLRNFRNSAPAYEDRSCTPSPISRTEGSSIAFFIDAEMLDVADSISCSDSAASRSVIAPERPGSGRRSGTMSPPPNPSKVSARNITGNGITSRSWKDLTQIKSAQGSSVMRKVESSAHAAVSPQLVQPSSVAGSFPMPPPIPLDEESSVLKVVKHRTRSRRKSAPLSVSQKIDKSKDRITTSKFVDAKRNRKNRRAASTAATHRRSSQRQRQKQRDVTRGSTVEAR